MPVLGSPHTRLHLWLVLSVWYCLLVCSECIERETSELVSKGFPDIHTVAGKVFQYTLPQDAFKGNIIHYKITEAGSSTLPKWLEFDNKTDTLQGVPVTTDEGYTYISVTAHIKDGQNTINVTDVFLLDVRLFDEETTATHAASPLNPVKAVPLKSVGKGDEELPKGKVVPKTCSLGTPRTFATIVLDSDLSELTGGQRVSLLQKLADFLALDANALTLATRRSSAVGKLLDNTVLAAGPGNADPKNVLRNAWGIEISWTLSCGVFKKVNDFSMVIEHNSKSGRLTSVTGFPVIGWHVSSEKITETAAVRRKRQIQAGLAGTPLPTPTVTVSTPSVLVPTTSTIMVTSSSTIETTSSVTQSITSTETIPFTTRTIPLPVTSTVAAVTSSSPVLETPSSPRRSSPEFSTTLLPSSTPDLTVPMTSTPELIVSTTAVDIVTSSAVDTSSMEASSAVTTSPTLPSSSFPSPSPSPVVPPIETTTVVFLTTSELEPTPVTSTTPAFSSPSTFSSTPVIITSSVITEESSSVPPLSSSTPPSPSPSPSPPVPSPSPSYSPSPTLPVVTSSQPVTSSPVEPPILITPTPSEIITSTPPLSSTETPPLTSTPVFSSSPVLITSSQPPSSSPVVPSPSPSAITSKISISSSAIVIPTTPEYINQPPVVFTPMDDIEITVGHILEFSIPLGTFYDPEQGLTDRLQLSLETSSGFTLPSKSWIQFDSNTQLIYGIPLQEHLALSPSKYRLIATDSEGLTVNTDFTVYIIPRHPNETINHQFVLSLDFTYPLFLQQGSNRYELARDILDFYSDPNLDDVVVDEISDNYVEPDTILFTFHNSSLSGAYCDKGRIAQVYDQMADDEGFPRENFNITLLPQFQIIKVTLNLFDDCLPTSSSLPVLVTSTPYMAVSSSEVFLITTSSPPFTSTTSFITLATSDVTSTPILPESSSPIFTFSSLVTSDIVSTSMAIPVTPTPTPTMSSIVISSSVPPTEAPIDRKPMLINHIDQLTVRVGHVLEHLIPADTFYDMEDGDTRNLRLVLLTMSGEPLPQSSWIQYDGNRQMIYGIPLDEDYSSRPVEFLLLARDSAGQSARDALEIVIQPASSLVFTHQFVVTFDENFANFMTKARNRYDVASKISQYYRDTNSRYVSVDSIEEGSVVWTYSNNSLPTKSCDLQTIWRLYSKLGYQDGAVTESFQRMMAPEYAPIKTELLLLGACGPAVPPSPKPSEEAVVVVPLISHRDAWEKAIIPAVIIAILFLLCGLLACFVYRRKRPGSRFLLRAEKPMYVSDRRPIILPDEKEIKERQKPVQPAILQNDLSPYTTSPPPPRPPPTPPEIFEQTPPSPPPYRLPPYPESDYPDEEEDDPMYLREIPLQGTMPTPPPAYSPQAEYNSPPPNYRLPPPYNPLGFQTSKI